MPDPETTLSITAAERLVRVETKIDLMFSQGPAYTASVDARITRLERFMWLLLGFVAANGLVNAAQLLGVITPNS